MPRWDMEEGARLETMRASEWERQDHGMGGLPSLDELWSEGGAALPESDAARCQRSESHLPVASPTEGGSTDQGWRVWTDARQQPRWDSTGAQLVLEDYAVLVASLHAPLDASGCPDLQHDQLTKLSRSLGLRRLEKNSIGGLRAALSVFHGVYHDIRHFKTQRAAADHYGVTLSHFRNYYNRMLALRKKADPYELSAKMVGWRRDPDDPASAGGSNSSGMPLSSDEESASAMLLLAATAGPVQPTPTDGPDPITAECVTLVTSSSSPCTTLRLTEQRHTERVEYVVEAASVLVEAGRTDSRLEAARANILAVVAQMARVNPEYRHCFQQPHTLWAACRCGVSGPKLVRVGGGGAEPPLKLKVCSEPGCCVDALRLARGAAPELLPRAWLEQATEGLAGLVALDRVLMENECTAVDSVTSALELLKAAALPLLDVVASCAAEPGSRQFMSALIAMLRQEPADAIDAVGGPGLYDDQPKLLEWGLRLGSMACMELRSELTSQLSQGGARKAWTAVRVRDDSKSPLFSVKLKLQLSNRTKAAPKSDGGLDDSFRLATFYSNSSDLVIFVISMTAGVATCFAAQGSALVRWPPRASNVVIHYPGSNYLNESQVWEEIGDVQQAMTHVMVLASLGSLHSSINSVLCGSRWDDIVAGRADPYPLQSTAWDLAAVPPATLNVSQGLAFRLSLSVELIHGPPGTGKSAVIAVVVQLRAAAGSRVLAVASGNKAVDSLVDKLAEVGLTHLLVVGSRARIGPKARCYMLAERVKSHPAMLAAARRSALSLAAITDLKSMLDQVRTAGAEHLERRLHLSLAEAEATSRRATKAYSAVRLDVVEGIVRAIRVVACTTSSAAMLRQRLTREIVAEGLDGGVAEHIVSGLAFDIAVVDEAGAATEIESVIPALYGARSLVLVGDHLQLQPFTTLGERSGPGAAMVRQSLMERLASYYDDYGEEVAESVLGMTMLRTQYRMHPTICDAVSALFYKGLLGTAQSCTDRRPLQRPLRMWPVKGQARKHGTSLSNEAEAKAVEDLVRALGASGVVASRICVLSFYAGQTGLLTERLLGRANVQTADSMQGSEADFVILSCVRSGLLGPGFLNDARRVNVAISRARHCLVVVGDPDALRQAGEFWQGFLDRAVHVQSAEFPVQDLVDVLTLEDGTSDTRSNSFDSAFWSVLSAPVSSDGIGPRWFDTTTQADALAARLESIDGISVSCGAGGEAMGSSVCTLADVIIKSFTSDLVKSNTVKWWMDRVRLVEPLLDVSLLKAVVVYSLSREAQRLGSGLLATDLDGLGPLGVLAQHLVPGLATTTLVTGTTTIEAEPDPSVVVPADLVDPESLPDPRRASTSDLAESSPSDAASTEPDEASQCVEEVGELQPMEPPVLDRLIKLSELRSAERLASISEFATQPRTLCVWNAAGLLHRVTENADELGAFLLQYHPDILLVTEVRMPAAGPPGCKRGDGQPRRQGELARQTVTQQREADLIEESLSGHGYQAYWSLSESKYAGTGLLVRRDREQPTQLRYNLDPATCGEQHSAEGRVIVASWEEFQLLGTYVPNNGLSASSLRRRLKWDEEMTLFMTSSRSLPLVWAGDLNVAVESGDVGPSPDWFHPQPGQDRPWLGDLDGHPGCTTLERKRFADIVRAGNLVDVYRMLRPVPDWSVDSTWRGAPGCGRYSGKGMRLDYVLVQEDLAPKVCIATVTGCDVTRVGFLGSDHCPLFVEFAPVFIGGSLCDQSYPRQAVLESTDPGSNDFDTGSEHGSHASATPELGLASSCESGPVPDTAALGELGPMALPPSHLCACVLDCMTVVHTVGSYCSSCGPCGNLVSPHGCQCHHACGGQQCVVSVKSPRAITEPAKSSSTPTVSARSSAQAGVLESELATLSIAEAMTSVPGKVATSWSRVERLFSGSVTSPLSSVEVAGTDGTAAGVLGKVATSWSRVERPHSGPAASPASSAVVAGTDVTAVGMAEEAKSDPAVQDGTAPSKLPISDSSSALEHDESARSSPELDFSETFGRLGSPRDTVFYEPGSRPSGVTERDEADIRRQLHELCDTDPGLKRYRTDCGASPAGLAAWADRLTQLVSSQMDALAADRRLDQLYRDRSHCSESEVLLSASPLEVDFSARATVPLKLNACRLVNGGLCGRDGGSITPAELSDVCFAGGTWM